MTRDTLYLSKKGLKDLKKAIAKLEHDKRRTQAALKELDRGDSREDRLERAERLAQLETIESELADKNYTLLHAKELPKKRDALKVALGSVVDLIDSQGRLIRYQIVESLEANPSDGRISMSSPLGAQLVGRRVKDVVEWTNRGLTTNRLQLIAIR